MQSFELTGLFYKTLICLLNGFVSFDFFFGIVWFKREPL